MARTLPRLCWTTPRHPRMKSLDFNTYMSCFHGKGLAQIWSHPFKFTSFLRFVPLILLGLLLQSCFFLHRFCNENLFLSLPFYGLPECNIMQCGRKHSHVQSKWEILTAISPVGYHEGNTVVAEASTPADSPVTLILL